MRRLTPPASSERGAVAVLFAILLVPLIGFGAIAVDVGAVYAERAQLQSGADAAALAIASDCGQGLSPCTSGQNATGIELGSDNANDVKARADTVVNSGARTVKVTTRTLTKDGKPYFPHPLADLLPGVGPSTIGAIATAEWGYLESAKVFPIAFPSCRFDEATLANYGVAPKAFRFDKLSTDNGNTPDPEPCPPAVNGATLPGSIGWIKDNDGDCSVIVNQNSQAPADPGADAAICTTILQDLIIRIKASQANPSQVPLPTVLVPIFTAASGTGSGVTYTLSKFAVFEVGGWKLSGGGEPKTFTPANISFTKMNFGRWIWGRFVGTTIDPADVVKLGGVPSGPLVVRLIPNS